MKLDLENIKKLANSVKENDLSEITVESEGIKIVLKRETPKQEVILSKPIDSHQIEIESKMEEVKKEIVTNKINTGKKVVSPMVGNFYLAPSPGAEPFVKKGKIVSEKDVLCIVEAMKMMNEVKSPFSGTVLEICVKDGETVKKGDVLFIIE